MVLTYIIVKGTLKLIELIRPEVFGRIAEECRRLEKLRTKIIKIRVDVSSKLRILYALLIILVLKACIIALEEAFVIGSTLALYFTVLPNCISYVIACLLHGLLHFYNIKRGVKLYPVLQLYAASVLSIYVLFTRDIMLLFVLHAVDHVLTNSIDELIGIMLKVKQDSKS